MTHPNDYVVNDLSPHFQVGDFVSLGTAIIQGTLGIKEEVISGVIIEKGTYMCVVYLFDTGVKYNAPYMLLEKVDA